jgi:hypothetical protein
MKSRVIIAGLLMAAIAAPMEAQTSSCAAGSTQDACQKAVDLLNYMTPQLSTALASGNPTLGQGGTLGGLGHFSIDIRASAVNGSLPQLNNVTLNPITRSNAQPFTTKNQYIPAVSADAGIGLFRGFSLGVTHVGGVDGIVTMTYLPTIKSDSGSGSNTGNFTVKGSNEKFGYGFRLGLLEESVVTPGISFAWVKRDLPTVSFSGSINTDNPTPASPSGTVALNDFTVNTTAWRVTAAKSFLIFGLSLGVGQDKYDATSTIMATVNGVGGGTQQVPGNFTMTRTNEFVGAYMNLFIFKLEGEYGLVSGGTDNTYNTFDKAASSSRSYFTLGLRFGWGR